MRWCEQSHRSLEVINDRGNLTLAIGMARRQGSGDSGALAALRVS
ncbi:MAG: hypothetical protein QS721_15435 [Candidatus Endonucleobacter sp. (ex Gigantidas childressi)]|nr:hypothetical protein [Candidatus Endonucleobacter sp. (ex Gigantidas childressi)]